MFLLGLTLWIRRVDTWVMILIRVVLTLIRLLYARRGMVRRVMSRSRVGLMVVIRVT